jgi:alkylation response protein AidB-like acyl-CoA dehydrogenase
VAASGKFLLEKRRPGARACVELHFPDAHMMTIPDGISEIQKLIIGR